ncbi:MAG: bifunctional folylpolyglutamate synthase/dihydrofolate synthase [Actinobacteria bacterium]|nr:bifunctional folylpolyglutamate synthase/dihydrofolate synthase [Actinomycetota bacterium]
MDHGAAVGYVESLAILGMRFGLDRMGRLLAELGDPHRSPRAIHVVGTNGKTSTSRFAAAILTGQGLRTGSYLSPHITGWHERIAVDGSAISPAEFAATITAVRAAAERLGTGADDLVTQFEVLTAAAFWTFAGAIVDAVVVEAGLGGRYDATNVLDGAVVALTNVAREHTALLGETEDEIAAEKLAVADERNELVIGRLSQSAAPAVARVVAARGLRGWLVGRDIHVESVRGELTITTPYGRHTGLRLGVAGRFQLENAAVAVGACERFLGRALDTDRLREALASADVPGRLEWLSLEPPLLIDGAHNPAGVAALVASLPSVVGDRSVVVVASMLDDKDIDAMTREFAGHVSAIVATSSRHPRARDANAIAESARGHGLAAEAEPDLVRALSAARARAGDVGVVLVCGSLFLLADVRALAGQLSAAPNCTGTIRGVRGFTSHP